MKGGPVVEVNQDLKAITALRSNGRQTELHQKAPDDLEDGIQEHEPCKSQCRFQTNRFSALFQEKACLQMYKIFKPKLKIKLIRTVTTLSS